MDSRDLTDFVTDAHRECNGVLGVGDGVVPWTVGRLENDHAPDWELRFADEPLHVGGDGCRNLDSDRHLGPLVNRDLTGAGP